MSLDYTPDRHVALCLTALDQVVVDDTIMRARSGQELPFGVFAALLVAGSRGYLDAHPPGPDSAEWPVRLTVTGTQALSRFDREHSRPRLSVGLVRSTPAASTAVSAPATAGSGR